MAELVRLLLYDGSLGGPVPQPSTTPNDPSSGGTGFGAGGPNTADGYGAAGTGAAGMGAAGTGAAGMGVAGSGATGTGAEEAGSHYDAASEAGHEGDCKTGTGDLGSLVGDVRSPKGIALPTRLLTIC